MTEMTGKVRLSKSISLDGFITGPDRGLGSGVRHLRYRVVEGGRP
ncbi:hypothetical protein ACQPZJ_24390 [Actinoplanes sp. CA-054009]